MYKRIKALCDKEGITIAELERRILMPNASIIHWKENANPTMRSLIKISKYFGVTIDYLVYGDKKSNGKKGD